MIYTAEEERIEDRRIRKTKKALRLALAELLGSKPIEEITVKEITDSANIHRGTFYNHYLDVFDLKKRMQEEIEEEFKTLIEEHNYSRLGECPYEVLVAILKHIEENQEIIPMLLGNQENAEFKKKIYDLLLDYCLSAYLPPPFMGAPNLHIYEECFCEAGTIGVLTSWMKSTMRSPPEEVAKSLCNILKNATSSI